MKKKRIIAWIILVTGMAMAAGEHDNHAAEAKNAQQTLCPVMEGNPINPDLYTDYEGERVYFCCEFCVAAFQKNPEKYLAKLPQFTETDEHAYDNENSGLQLYQLTKPLGISTFSLILLTALAGLFRRKLKRRFLRIHKILAGATVVSASLHALTVWLGY